jgi:radical SAM protein with 4Fe4S-binding SPASM domain
MSWELFQKIVEQLRCFPRPLKRIQFIGLGEPLLNARLSQMIAELNHLRLFEKQVVVYSNGLLLDEKMTHALVTAGLTRLYISLQGLSAEQYKKNADVVVDFPQFLNQIRYFYGHRDNTKLHIKIIDALLEADDEARFYKMFGDICDEIFIEHLGLLQPAMVDVLSGVVDKRLNLYGQPLKNREVCPFAFYALQIDADGRLYPCPPAGVLPSFALTNISEMTLREFWDGRKRNDFLTQMLKKGRQSIEGCNICSSWNCINSDSDYLDTDREILLQRLQGRETVG